MNDREHAYLPTLKRLFAEGRCDRREFLRTATLLGASAASAYAFAGGEAFAQTVPAPRRGGSVRVSGRAYDIRNPHAASNVPSSNVLRQVVDYLASTDYDNITRPMLLDRWQPSDDLKTWTLHLRRNATWRDGRKFTADDVTWNLKRLLDPKTGSSVLGLMKGYMLSEVETGEKDDSGNPKKVSQLWDANAIEKVDDFTVRLNLKVPQLAVPEHLFHYPAVMLDPAQDGKFGVDMNGTGPFRLAEYEVGRRAVFKARTDHWGDGPYLDEVVFADLGDDENANLAALVSRQISAIIYTNYNQLPALKAMPGLTAYIARTASTIHARAHPIPPFTDLRVMRALRYAIDNDHVAQICFGELAYRAEHHHVSPIHPEYAALPPFKRDLAKTKQLLAEAGYPNGIDIPVPMTVPNSWHKPIAEALVGQWAEANIRVKLEVLPVPEWNKVWDKAPFACGDWSHRPLGVMCLALAYRTGVPWNETKFSHPQFDKLLDEAEATADVEKRRAITKGLETILQEEGRLVQPLFRSVFMYADSKLKGLRMHPTQYIRCNEWWLEA